MPETVQVRFESIPLTLTHHTKPHNALAARSDQSHVGGSSMGQLILTNAAKESGSERSAVWEKLQRELAKNTNNSNTSKRDSVVRSRGKEGEVK